MPQKRRILPNPILQMEEYVTERAVNHHQFYTTTRLLQELNPSEREKEDYKIYMERRKQRNEVLTKSLDLNQRQSSTEAKR